MTDFPDDTTQLTAVKMDPSLIDKIGYPCKEAQLIAVRADLNLINKIGYPCEEAQLIAVKANPDLINLIGNPTPKVVRLYYSLKNPPSLMEKTTIKH